MLKCLKLPKLEVQEALSLQFNFGKTLLLPFKKTPQPTYTNIHLIIQLICENMKSIYVFLTIVFFLLATYSGNAQSNEYLKGYIITINQDTIEGYIKDEKRTAISQSFYFKKQKSQLAEKKTTSEVKGFFMAASFHFEAIDFEINGSTEKRFLRKLVDGATKLYQYYDESAYDYVVVKQSGKSLQITKKDTIINRKIIVDSKYLGQLKNFFRDCPTVPSVKSLKWNKKSLSKGRRLKVKIGAQVGIRFLNADISGIQGGERAYEDDIRVFQFGGLVSLAYFDRLTLQVGATYNTYDTEGFVEFTIGTFSLMRNIKNIEIPINVKYNLFTKKKLVPYVIAGVRPGIFLSGEEIEIETRVGVPTTNSFDLDYDHVFGINLGIGLSYKITESLEGQLEFGYESLGMNLNINQGIIFRGFALNTKVFF